MLCLECRLQLTSGVISKKTGKSSMFPLTPILGTSLILQRRQFLQWVNMDRVTKNSGFVLDNWGLIRLTWPDAHVCTLFNMPRCTCLYTVWNTVKKFEFTNNLQSQRNPCTPFLCWSRVLHASLLDHWKRSTPFIYKTCFMCFDSF